MGRIRKSIMDFFHVTESVCVTQLVGTSDRGEGKTESERQRLGLKEVGDAGLTFVHAGSVFLGKGVRLVSQIIKGGN
jgi:hypothetical protein